MSRLVLLLLCACVLQGQDDLGELRLKVMDPAGLPVSGSITVTSQVNQVRQELAVDSSGTLVVKRLPFGMYRVRIERSGFAPYSDLVEIRSALPKELRVTMSLAPVSTAVVVTDTQTLVDPHQAETMNRIGPETLQDHAASLPGRALLDLVNTEPGWLLEANGVLHPRGSEYQTQYVVDGIPLTENRSPAFSPEVSADDVQSMNVMTAGYPAEFGRKMGGVIEVVTAKDSLDGLHAKVTTSGGSFDTAGGSFLGQYGWGRNTFSVDAGAARTDRYLDPPVEQNYTNAGTSGDYSAHYERDLDDRNRIGFILRRGQSRFEVPNEQLQQAAGQRQDRGSGETAGQFSYQHIFSPNIVGDVNALVRGLSAELWSNPLATPILAWQNRGLREKYFKATVSDHGGHHEFKAGVEADFGSVRESFSYDISDPSQFDPGTPRAFQFTGRHPDREQAVFAQDLMRFGNWTFDAGLRWDHYGFLVEQSALSPRFGAAWNWPGTDLVLRASYDRIFQTPAFENLLLASSPTIESLSGNVLRLPVRPSLGNFYEAGLTKALFGKLRLDANYYLRSMNNYADDDLLLNTGVSFPIAFRQARIRGTEVKLSIPRWGAWSGYVSYSNMLGVGYFPATGGLFLGDNAVGVLSATNSFPVSQDQRNTVQSRFRRELTPRIWLAAGASYGSGLPVEFDGTYADAVAQYGQRIVDRVNLNAGRVRPSFELSLSAGLLVWRRDRHSVRLQADVENLGNRLNVIDFAGLFSGTALGAPRSAAVRLQVEY